MNLAKENQSLSKSIKRIPTLLGLTLLSLSPMVGQSQTVATAQTNDQKTVQIAPEVTVLEVDGEKISAEEYKFLCKKVFHNIKARGDKDLDLDSVIFEATRLARRNKVIKTKTEELNLTCSKKQIEEELKKEEYQIPKISQKLISKMAEISLLEQNLRNYFPQLQTATDEEIKNYYNGKEKYYYSNYVELTTKEIVFYKLDSNGIMLPKNKIEEIKNKALMVQEKLKADADFDILAEQYSDDKDSKIFGYKKSCFKKNLDEHLFYKIQNLNENEISNIIETENAFYIEKLLAKTPPKEITLNERKKEIDYAIRFEKSEGDYKYKIIDWISSTKVTNEDEIVIKSLAQAEITEGQEAEKLKKIINNLSATVLEINGEKISLGEFELILYSTYWRNWFHNFNNDPFLLKAFTMNNIIKTTIKSQLAKKLNIPYSEQELADYRDTAVYRDRIDNVAFDNFTKKEVMSFHLNEWYEKKYPPTDEDLRAFYDSEIAKKDKYQIDELEGLYENVMDDFFIPAQIKIAYIKLSSKKRDELTNEEFNNLILKYWEIKDMIKPDSNFSEFAKRYSQDKNYQEPGEFVKPLYGESVKPSSIDRSLFYSAYALKKNEVSGLIDCSAGLYIVKLFDKIPYSFKPFTEVKDSIKISIEYSTAFKKYNEDIENLIKDAKVTKFDKLLNLADMKKSLKSMGFELK